MLVNLWLSHQSYLPKRDSVNAKGGRDGTVLQDITNASCGSYKELPRTQVPWGKNLSLSLSLSLSPSRARARALSLARSLARSRSGSRCVVNVCVCVSECLSECVSVCACVLYIE